MENSLETIFVAKICCIMAWVFQYIIEGCMTHWHSMFGQLRPNTAKINQTTAWRVRISYQVVYSCFGESWPDQAYALVWNQINSISMLFFSEIIQWRIQDFL